MTRVLLGAIAVCLTGPSHAAPTWTTLRSEHFTIVGQVAEADLRDIALRLEQFTTALRRILPNGKIFTSVPTVVIVFESEAELDPFKVRVAGKRLEGGFFAGRSDVNYIVVAKHDGRDLFSTVYHEFTHQLEHNNFPVEPVWLDEGLAEFYRTFALDREARRVTIGTPIPEHLRMLREQFAPIAGLLAANYEAFHGTAARPLYYAESWAFVHYLMMEAPEPGSRIMRYLFDLRKGIPDEVAFRTAFGVDFAAFEQNVKAYVQKGSFRTTTYVFDTSIPIDRGEAARVLSHAESETSLGDLLLHLNRLDEAAVRLEEVVKLDPSFASAYSTLGSIRSRQNRHEEALGYLKRAASLEPNSFRVQYAYALAAIGSIPHWVDIQASDPRLSDITAALAKAVDADPANAEALSWLAQCHMLGGRLNEARATLTRAVDLAPGNAGYALRLAQVRVMQGDLSSAYEFLRPLALQVRTMPSGRALASLVRALEGEGPAAAGPDALPGGSSERAFKPGPDLRTIRDGERRIFGHLERIDCRTDGVSMTLQTAVGTMTFVAMRLADVEFVSHLPQLAGNVACGTREPPEIAFVTFHEMPGIGKANVTRQARAVEILPPGYFPDSPRVQ